MLNAFSSDIFNEKQIQKDNASTERQGKNRDDMRKTKSKRKKTQIFFETSTLFFNFDIRKLKYK